MGLLDLRDEYTASFTFIGLYDFDLKRWEFYFSGMLHLIRNPLPELIVLSDGCHFLRKVCMLGNEKQKLLVYKSIIQPRIIQQFVDTGAYVNLCQQPISRGFCAVIPG